MRAIASCAMQMKRRAEVKFLLSYKGQAGHRAGAFGARADTASDEPRRHQIAYIRLNCIVNLHSA